MKSTFTSDIRCQACVKTITPFLDALNDVESWKVDTDHPQKLLHVFHGSDATVHDVELAIHKAGFHLVLTSEENVPLPNNPRLVSLSAAKLSQKNAAADAEGTFRWSTYKPLALVLAYVVGATVFTQWTAGDWHWHRAMELFMGFFFLAFAFFKLLDVGKFAVAFSSYDPVAKRSLAYGLAYPWIEVGLGLTYLSGAFATIANLATLLIMSVGLVGVVDALRHKRTIQCACLGTAFNLPMSIVTVIENGAMIAMSIAMLLFSNRA